MPKGIYKRTPETQARLRKSREDARILCPHNILGISKCKICQKEKRKRYYSSLNLEYREKRHKYYLLHRHKHKNFKGTGHHKISTSFKKGIIPWNKGKTKKDFPQLSWKPHPISDLTRKKQSESRKRLYQEHPEIIQKMKETKKRLFKEHPETRERISESKKRLFKEHPKTRERMSEAQKRLHKEHPELRERMSESRKRLYQEHPEIIQKMKETKKRLYQEHPELREKLRKVRIAYLNAHPEFGQRISKTKKRLLKEHPERKQELIEICKKMTNPKKDTKIEQKIQQQLDDAGLEYKKHYTISFSPNRYHQADIFLQPHDKYYKGLVIEADGDYWHNRPAQIEKDKRITNELFNQGYHVLRLPENHIKERDFDITKYIKEIIPTHHIQKKKLVKI